MQIRHVGAGSQTAHASSTARRARGARLRKFCARILPLAMVAAFSAGGFLSVEAQAGTLTVWACHRPDGQVAPLDWTSTITAPAIDNWNTCGAGWAGAFGTTVFAQPHPGHTYGHWKFTPPSGTTVVSFQYGRSGSVYGWASINVFHGQLPIWDSAHLRELCLVTGRIERSGERGKRIRVDPGYSQRFDARTREHQHARRLGDGRGLFELRAAGPYELAEADAMVALDALLQPRVGVERHGRVGVPDLARRRSSDSRSSTIR